MSEQADLTVSRERLLSQDSSDWLAEAAALLSGRLLAAVFTPQPARLCPHRQLSSLPWTAQVLVVIARVLPSRHADLRPLFELLDSDHSGFLSLAELRAGLQQHSLQVQAAT